MKRRQVLFGGSALGVIVGSAPGNLLAMRSNPGHGRRLTRERFQDLVNAPFDLLDSRHRRVERLVLSAVEDGPACPGTDQFALVFRGDGEAPRRPATYTLEHAEEGRFALYLEPSREPAGDAYRASFSLLRSGPLRTPSR